MTNRTDLLNTHGAAAVAATVDHTDCCIVGGGPAGAVLALLLARQGIATTLLEAHNDFDRDFRGWQHAAVPAW
jgi:NADPH-dependent 2,4-dienoyl-CoA reductase/sulfur reductase-like enzyme